MASSRSSWPRSPTPTAHHSAAKPVPRPGAVSPAPRGGRGPRPIGPAFSEPPGALVGPEARCEQLATSSGVAPEVLASFSTRALLPSLSPFGRIDRRRTPGPGFVARLWCAGLRAPGAHAELLDMEEGDLGETFELHAEGAAAGAAPSAVSGARRSPPRAPLGAPPWRCRCAAACTAAVARLILGDLAVCLHFMTESKAKSGMGVIAEYASDAYAMIKNLVTLVLRTMKDSTMPPLGANSDMTLISSMLEFEFAEGLDTIEKNVANKLKQPGSDNAADTDCSELRDLMTDLRYVISRFVVESKGKLQALCEAPGDFLEDVHFRTNDFRLKTTDRTEQWLRDKGLFELHAKPMETPRRRGDHGERRRREHGEAQLLRSPSALACTGRAFGCRRLVELTRPARRGAPTARLCRGCGRRRRVRASHGARGAVALRRRVPRALEGCRGRHVGAAGPAGRHRHAVLVVE